MEQMTRMHADQRNGNLHITLVGVVTPHAAEELARLMTDRYQGRGNIFIHTAGVHDVTVGVRDHFNRLMRISPLPEEKIYLTGHKGLEMSHDRGKVLVRKEHATRKRCCGNCKGCACGTGKKAA